MEDKIKIYISEKTARILDKDAELFEFRRKDRRINRNAFLNTLITQYFETYQQERSALLKRIRQTLQEASVPDSRQAYLAMSLMDVISHDIKTAGKLDVTVSLKPTRKSADLIRYIESAYLEDTTLSGYFRDMFVSYTSVPRDEREKIIFREQYEIISEAVRKKRQLAFITEKDRNKLFVVSPYAVAASKEELFNYLLASYQKQPCSFRISRIRKAVISERDAEISPDVLSSLRKMEQDGPQYAFYGEPEICVRLTPQGRKKFDTFYIHRPVPDRIEDDLYYFRCSAGQCFQYFCRFGKDAVVLYPEKLREKLQYYYRQGYKAYTDTKEET